MEGRSMEYPTQQTQQTAPVHANTTTEIDLVEVFYLLWGHWWQILISLIAGAAIAFAGTYFLITPQYEASARIYIVSASNDSVVDLSDLQVGTSLTADYQELLLSRAAVTGCYQQLGAVYGLSAARKNDQYHQHNRYANPAHPCDKPQPTAGGGYCQRTGEPGQHLSAKRHGDRPTEPGGKCNCTEPGLQPQLLQEYCAGCAAGCNPLLHGAVGSLFNERHFCHHPTI